MAIFNSYVKLPEGTMVHKISITGGGHHLNKTLDSTYWCDDAASTSKAY